MGLAVEFHALFFCARIDIWNYRKFISCVFFLAQQASLSPFEIIMALFVFHLKYRNLLSPVTQTTLFLLCTVQQLPKPFSNFLDFFKFIFFHRYLSTENGKQPPVLCFEESSFPFPLKFLLTLQFLGIFHINPKHLFFLSVKSSTVCTLFLTTTHSWMFEISSCVSVLVDGAG